MLDFIALKLMVPLLTRCKLCLLKFIQLTENKRQTEYKQSARIMMHKMSNPVVKKVKSNICVCVVYFDGKCFKVWSCPIPP